MVRETWYPHWRVYVNQEEQPLLRLNGNFIGVYVAEPDSIIRFRYTQPWYIWPAYLTSALSAIAIVAIFIRRPRHLIRHACRG